MTRLPRFYYFANYLLHGLYPLLRMRVTVSGRANVPLTGPLLVVSNHLSNADPPLIGSHLPRDVVFMSKAETFVRGGLSKWIVQNYGAFPVRRGEADLSAIRTALQLLKEGQVLFIAPEGTRSRTSQLQAAQEGAALIAARAAVPILPIGISGQERLAANLRRYRPTDVCLSIGQPFTLRTGERRPDRAALQAMSHAIMERIAEQLPPAYRGRYREATHSDWIVL